MAEGGIEVYCVHFSVFREELARVTLAGHEGPRRRNFHPCHLGHLAANTFLHSQNDPLTGTFPVAAVTNHYTLGGLKQQHLIL